MAEFDRDFTRTALLLLCIGGLMLGAAWIVEPFLPATIWATMVVVATWPVLRRVQVAMGGRRGPAVVVMTAVVLLVFLVPAWLAIATLLGHANELRGLAQAAVAFRVPPPPHWVQTLPLIGPWIGAGWGQAQDSGLHELAPRLAPYAGRATRWFVGAIGGLGRLMVQFLLTVVGCALLYANGERAAAFADHFGHRLGGARGRQMVALAGQAIRAVAIGVMVTALVECLVGGLGLWIAGVPLAAVLTAVMFVVCVAQAGPGLVLIPAVVWMYGFRDAGPATFLLVCSVVAICIDNVLRPFLIRKEADLPLLLVLVGVIGGLIAFGIIGIFIGPVVLAVGYTLLRAWIDEDAPVTLALAPSTTAAPLGGGAVDGLSRPVQ